MNFKDLHEEISLQIGARTFLNQLKEDIFQEAFLLMFERKMALKKAVKKAINKYSYEARPLRRPKHVNISTVDIAVQEAQPSLVDRHPLTERQQRRLFEKFDDVLKAKAVLEDYGHRFTVMHSTNHSYDLAIQLVDRCPLCGCKGCFTIYENNSYLTYHCFNSNKEDSYTKYPNNISSILSLLTGYSKEEVRDRIYKNLLDG